MEDNKPKKKLKIKLRKTAKAPGADQELVDMVKKMSDWTPQSNAAVLEVANRLAQAAREKITPDMFKEDAGSLDKALALCSKIKGHTLSKFNGIGEDHDYVVDVAISGKMLELSTVHMFKRNRIGEWAVSARKIYVDAGMVMADRRIVTRKQSGNVRCNIAGYNLDTAHSAEAYRELEGLIKFVSAAIPKPATKKRTSK